MKRGVKGLFFHRTALIGALAACFVLVKSVPWIGVTPWACAAVDAVVLLATLFLSERYGALCAVPVVLLSPPIDWLQGSLPGFLIPFVAVGYALSVVIWHMPMRFRPVKAGLCALAASLPPVLGTAVGYMALKALGASEAARTALRSRWYVIAWYAGACALAAFIDMRREAGKGKPAPKEGKG